MFLRLAAADRMLGLIVGGVDLADECLKIEPARDDAPSTAMLEQLEEFGRSELAEAARENELLAASRRRRRRLLLVLLLLLLAGGLAASLQPSAVRDISGAKREGAYVVGPGEVLLCRGTRVKLGPGTRARFWCAFRWERPAASLSSGRLTVLAGRLRIRSRDTTAELFIGQSASRSEGRLLIGRAASGPPRESTAKAETDSTRN
jgi:hypothetical protein